MTPETLLLRQINPSWIQNNRVTSQAFKPTPKDEKKLSVYDGDQIDAEASWRHFSGSQGLQSIGVLAVSHRECTDQDLDVQPSPERFPEHVDISFEGANSNTAIKRLAQLLTAAALERGWQFRANEGEP